MFDKLAQIVLNLADKHLPLATLIIGMLILYLFGFDADKLTTLPYALIALIISDMFIRVAAYIHVMIKIENINTNIKNNDPHSEKLNDIYIHTKTLSELHNTVVVNITNMNTILLKLCNIMRGMPNKAQLITFITMRTKLLHMEIVEETINHLYANKIITTMSTLNRKKLVLDLKKSKEKYYKDISTYLSKNVLKNAQIELDAELDMYIEEIIELIEDTRAEIPEKIYNVIIVNNTKETNINAIWNHHIQSLSEEVQFDDEDM